MLIIIKINSIAYIIINNICSYLGKIHVQNMNTKVIRHHDNGGERSLNSIYEQYLSAIRNEGPFYKKPIVNSLSFSKQVLGVKMLGQITKRMCAYANIQGNFTSHFGKKTCATALYHVLFWFMIYIFIYNTLVYA